jgi:hypothetical protein
MLMRGPRARRRNVLLGAVAACTMLFAMQAPAQASHYSLSLVFEFHNGFPQNTQVKVVKESDHCATVHPSEAKEIGTGPRVNLGSVDINTGGGCFFDFATATMKLENARTGKTLAVLGALQSGPRLFDVNCKKNEHASPAVKSCTGGNDPLGPRWYWRIYHQK